MGNIFVKIEAARLVETGLHLTKNPVKGDVREPVFPQHALAGQRRPQERHVQQRRVVLRHSLSLNPL